MVTVAKMYPSKTATKIDIFLAKYFSLKNKSKPRTNISLFDEADDEWKGFRVDVPDDVTMTDCNTCGRHFKSFDGYSFCPFCGNFLS